MHYADFEEIRPLPTADLRRLLHEGEPVVRAWAGWELGLRIGRAADPELAKVARESPTPGVRRLLLVILAGHGERDVLEAFAFHDPDDHVRATAAQYLGMTASPNDTALNELLTEVLARDPSPAVRWEILRLAKKKQAQIPKSLIEASVVDTDRNVRYIAAENLLADATTGFPAALEPRPIHEIDDELRAMVTGAWIQAGGARGLLGRLADAASPALGRVIELLSAIAVGPETFGWEDLESFANRDPRVNALIARLLRDPHEAHPFSWLLGVSLEPFNPLPPATSREASNQITALYIAASTAQERLGEALDRVDPMNVSDDAREAVHRLAAAVDTRLEEERAIARDEEGIELDDLAPSELPPLFCTGRQAAGGAATPHRVLVSMIDRTPAALESERERERGHPSFGQLLAQRSATVGSGRRKYPDA